MAHIPRSYVETSADPWQSKPTGSLDILSFTTKNRKTFTLIKRIKKRNYCQKPKQKYTEKQTTFELLRKEQVVIFQVNFNDAEDS